MHTFLTGRFLAAAVVTTVCVGALGSAEASTIPFDYTYDPANVLIDNTGDDLCTGSTTANTVSSLHCKALQFTYLLDGFDTATDDLTSGSLTLTFYDDNTPGPDNGGSLDETVNISLDGVLTGLSPVLITNGSTPGNPFSPPAFNVLAQLADGQLTILLSIPQQGEGSNDFYFASSRLTASADRNETQPQGPSTDLPEPATLLLFGAAAATLASQRRRQKR